MPWSGSGAASGAATGAQFGPWGAVIGGVAGGLLGGDEKDGDSRTSGSQTQNSSGVVTTVGSQTEDLISQLIERIDSKTSGTGKETTKKGTAQSDAALAGLVDQIPGFINKFSKDNAIADSRDAVSAALSEVLNEHLPGIQTMTSMGGGYNSTTTKLLTDNVAAQAAAAGAKVRQDTITQYAGIQEAGANAIMKALGLIQEGNSSTLTEAEEETSSDTDSRGTENKYSTLGQDEYSEQSGTLTENSATDMGVDY
jgi:hypothetical protein